MNNTNTKYTLEEKYNGTNNILKELEIEEIENGIIVPGNPGEYCNFEGFPLKGGVCDEKFNFIELSSLYLSNQKIITGIPEDLDKNNIEYIDEEVIYLGCLSASFYAYGDYLINAIARLWIYLRNGYGKNIKGCYILSNQLGKYIELFKLFGLKEENLIEIKKATRFKKVIIPGQSVILGVGWHEEYKKTLNEICKNVHSKNYEKIYLSRSQFGHCKVYGEELLEDTFRKNGYKILYPEKLSIEEQIAYMKGCKYLAGVVGSAMHNVVFAQDGINCFCFNRSPHFADNQKMLNDVRKSNSIYVDAFVDVVPTHFCTNPFLIGINECLLKFFEDYGLSYDRKLFYNSFRTNLFSFLKAYSEYVSKHPEQFPKNISMDKIVSCFVEMDKLENTYFNPISEFKIITNKIFSVVEYEKYIKITILGIKINFDKNKWNSRKFDYK